MHESGIRSSKPPSDAVIAEPPRPLPESGKGRGDVHGTHIQTFSAYAAENSANDESVHVRCSTADCRTNLEQDHCGDEDDLVVKEVE